MTFTYDPANPNTVLARTRLKTGDVVPVLKNAEGVPISGFLSDEELEVIFVDAGTTGSASASDFRTMFAVKAVKLILGKIAREQDTDGAGIRSTRTQKTEQYRDLLRDLEAELLGEIEIIQTGTSITEERTLKEDTDWKGPVFEIGQDDHFGTGERTRRRNIEEPDW
ncbi:MAG: hypothetical protein GTO22_14155 [Gemmatimonadales bacterium]|nr:hypothetical protein [Gemmatimonadales bacterium]